MGSTSKLNKLLTTDRDKCEAEDWIFSLTPMGVAFVFYVMFIMSTNIEPKGDHWHCRHAWPAFHIYINNITVIIPAPA
jgi:hypothetical protein